MEKRLEFLLGFGYDCNLYSKKSCARQSDSGSEIYVIFADVSAFYIGLVFLCVALTVLSVQQLSDSVKYKFRYRVLSQIGYSRREIRRMIFKQLVGYYLCPACVALAISGLVCVYTGGKFDFYTGVQAAPATYFLISSALFFGIYLVYFIITYIGFCRNVEEWG